MDGRAVSDDDGIEERDGSSDGEGNTVRYFADGRGLARLDGRRGGSDRVTVEVRVCDL